MVDPSFEATSEIEAINRVGRSARQLRRSWKWLVWGNLPLFIAGFYLLATSVLEVICGHKINRGALDLYACLLMLPTLIMGFWTGIKHDHLRRAVKKLPSISAQEIKEAHHRSLSQLIGPLLDIIMTGVVSDISVITETKLLQTALEEIQASDEVLLTQDQRERLHEIVIPKHWEWLTKSGSMPINYKAVCRELLPTALPALGLLGNTATIPLLERFSKKTKSDTLRLAALHSVEQIRERIPYGSEQMLRGARAPEEPATLLRAISAGKTQDHASELLLRATREGNGNDSQQ